MLKLNVSSKDTSVVAVDESVRDAGWTLSEPLVVWLKVQFVVRVRVS